MKLPKLLKRKKKPKTVKVQIQCSDGTFVEAEAIAISKEEVDLAFKEANK